MRSLTKDIKNIKFLTNKEHMRECHPDFDLPITKNYVVTIYRSINPSEKKSANITAKNHWDALRKAQYYFPAPLYHIVRVIEK